MMPAIILDRILPRQLVVEILQFYQVGDTCRMALYFKSIYSAESLSTQMANDHYKGQNLHILNKEEKKKNEKQ